MRRRASRAASRLELTILVFAVMATFSFDSTAQGLPPASDGEALPSAGAELQLEVYVNDVSSELIATLRQDPAGNLSIEPAQLRNVGILPAEQAKRPDGWIDIARLPNIGWEYDRGNQVLRLSAAADALAPKVIDATADGASPFLAVEVKEEAQQNSAGTGALINYTFYGSAGGDTWSQIHDFQGASALLEARTFSPYGVLSSSQIVGSTVTDTFDMTRLDTTWSYSDEARMITYRAGDFITGGLAWSRPTRLGGLQIQRNFALRPDLVTMPLPVFSGSAAVPSTVDIYVDNARRLSQQVPAGPFAVTNIPIVTGNGNARVVVRDSLGRETVTEQPFFASADLLAAGLFDFSAEIGYARRSFGIDSFDYDEALLGSLTARYGLTPSLTVEGHMEAGEDFYNVGIGGIFTLANHALGTLSASTSRFGAESGFQLSASIEADLLGAQVYARTQRTFGDYDDLASVGAEDRRARLPGDGISGQPPRALDQVSISSPLSFDETTLNLSLTQIENFDDSRTRIVGMTANRPIGERANVFLTAYKDLGSDQSYGIFAGLSWSFGENLSASVGGSYGNEGYAVTADVSKAEKPEIGSYGWRLRGAMGKTKIAAASGSYRTPVARLEAGVEQIDRRMRAYGQAEGSIVVADGDMFFAGRVDDAFGVVDAGAPDVAVLSENRPIGRTNRRGKILLPNLRSYDDNRISIDPTNLPLDARIDTTHQVVRPTDRAGAVVDFNVETGLQSALIIVRDETGAHLAAGAAGTTAGGADLLVGYDGQLFLNDVSGVQTIDLALPTGGTCRVVIPAVTVAAGSMGEGEVVCIPVP